MEVSLIAEEGALLVGAEEEAGGIEILASNVTVEGFSFEDHHEVGILVDGARGAHGTTIKGNTFSDGAGAAIRLIDVNRATIDGNHVEDQGTGVIVESSQDVKVSNNDIRSIDHEAIRLGPTPSIDEDPFAVVEDILGPDPGTDEVIGLLFDLIEEFPQITLALENQEDPLGLLPVDESSSPLPSSTHLVEGNVIQSCDVGILVHESIDDALLDNQIQACGDGIFLDNAEHPTLEDNQVEANDRLGIRLEGTTDATLSRNIMEGNAGGMDIFTSFSHEIDSTNLIDGKPVHYYTDEAGLTIEGPLDAGFLGIVDSTDVTLRGFEMSNARSGPMLVNVQGATIEDLVLKDNMDGMRLGQTSFVHIEDVRFEGNDVALLISQTPELARGHTVINSTFEANGHGVYLAFSSALMTIQGNTFEDNTVSGIAAFMQQQTTAKDLHIQENRFINNGPPTGGGLLSGNIAIMGNPGNALIEGNEIEEGSRGLSIRNAGPGLKVMGNEIRDARTNGIYLTNNMGLLLDGNTIEGNEVGLEFWGGEAHTLTNNMLTDNAYNLHMRYFTSLDTPITPGAHVIDTSNTVDGKPIHYYYGEPNVTIDANDDPGYIAVLEADDVTIRDVNLSGNGQGIALSHIGAATVENVTIDDTLQSIVMIEAQDTTIQDATLAPAAPAPNRGTGIDITRSQDVHIEDARITNAYHGVRVSTSERVTIEGNTFQDNVIPQTDGTLEGTGVSVFFSDDVRIEDNRFQNNTRGIELGCCPMTTGAPFATIHDNRIQQNDEGIKLDVRRGDVSVTRNKIVDNHQGILAVESEFAPGQMGAFEITRNVIQGNQDLGINNTFPPATGQIIPAPDNYWGAPDGPASPTGKALVDPITERLAKGDGDAVSEGETGVSNVAFDPFHEPPSIEPVHDQATIEDEAIKVDLHAESPSDDAIEWVPQTAPANATLIDHGDGTATLEWTPQEGDAGTHPVTLEAHDPLASSTLTFNVHVGTTNTPPVVHAPSSVQAQLDEEITLTAQGHDPDGPHPIEWTITTHPEPATPPEVTLDEDEAQWRWTPTMEDLEGVTVTFQAHDGIHTVSTTTQVNILHAPIVDILTPQEATTGYKSDHVLDGETTLLTANILIADAAEPAKVTFQPEGPSGPHIETPLDEGEAAIHHAYEKIGEHTLHVTVEDALGQTTTQERSLTVHPPKAPVADAGDDLLQQGLEPITLDGTSSYDPDQRPLDHAWTVHNDTHAWTLEPGPTPTWDPPQIGTYHATLTATDTTGATGTATIQLAVDDAITLDATILSDQDTLTPNERVPVAIHVRDHVGQGVPNAHVRLQTERFDGVQGGTEHVTTNPTGVAFATLPYDALIGDIGIHLPGEHILTLTATAAPHPQAPIQDDNTATIEEAYRVQPHFEDPV